jgi:hypothetical protein
VVAVRLDLLLVVLGHKEDEVLGKRELWYSRRRWSIKDVIAGAELPLGCPLLHLSASNPKLYGVPWPRRRSGSGGLIL